MSKKWLLILALAVALPVHAQVVNSDQVKTQANGGLAGDTNKALVAVEYRGTSAPSGPLQAGMRWCDTNTTPCVPKMYDGSGWTVPVGVNSFQTQADLSSFPGSPSDGQVFFSKSPHALCVYDGTATTWYCWSMTFNASAPSIVDVYTAAVISVPGAATAATSATAGSTSAGAYSYKITCRNANGGETTAGTASNSVSPGASKSNDLSSIPTCGTGGTNRNVYRSKANQDVTGPWYWVGNIGDNTTTTYHDGAADSALLLLSPDINFSAALPGSWTVVNNSANTTTGGCGGTGGTRGSMACYGGVSGQPNVVTPTIDNTSVRASLDISSYTSGNYTLQFRLKQYSLNGDGYTTIKAGAVFGMRQGTGDNAIRGWWFIGGGSNTGGCPSGQTQLPLSSSQHTNQCWGYRTSTGGAATSAVANNPWPEADAFPIYFRIVRKSATLNQYVSTDGVNWTIFGACSGVNNSNSQCSTDPTNFGTSALDHFELPMGVLNTGIANGGWQEIDQFTLTVN